MKEFTAIIVGFFVAAAIPAVWFAIYFPLFNDRSPENIVGSLFIYYFYSLHAVVLLGLPTFIILRPLRPGHWWSVAAIGFVLGIVVVFAIRGISGQLATRPPLEDTLAAGALAAGAAVAFWSIWRRSVTI